MSDWPMYYLAAIEREHTLKATSLLRPHDIDHKSWRLLAVLEEYGELTIGDLAKFAVLDRSSVSKMVVGLERQGLVERRESSRDKRQSVVALSAAGDEKYQVTAPLVRGLFEQYFEACEREDFDRLMALLRDMLARVRGAEPRPR